MSARSSDQQDALDALLKDLPRGRSEHHTGTVSEACFESPLNIASTESLRFDVRHNRESKLFLGVVGADIVTGEPLKDGRPNRYAVGGVPIGVPDDRHHLLLAGSRVGKGRGALLNVLATLPAQTSVVCLDPKGDLARETAAWRFEVLKQSGGVLDPFNCSGEGTRRYRCAFNPLDILVQSDRSTFVANARMIADALIVMGDFKDKHWDECSAQGVTAILGHVATHSNFIGRRNLVTAWKLASELATPDPHDPQRYLLEKEMLENDAAGGMIRAGARAFYDRTGGEFSSVLSNLRKHLDWISYECVQDTLIGESISLRDLKRKLMTLYVTLPAMRMNALRGWLRLIVQMALAACEEEQTLVGNQCVMLLDEFHVLGRLSAVETAIAELAGLGVKLYIVLQNLNQLQVYERNFETFIANSGVLQVMGCSDETSLKYVSDRMGQAKVAQIASSKPTVEQALQQGVRGDSWSIGTHPLMTPEEVGRYFSRDDKLLRQLILRPGYRPFICQRAFYDKHSLFRGRFAVELS